MAQKLKALRHLHGALNLETIEARPVFDGDELKDFEAEKRNRAKDIIEDFMIASKAALKNEPEACPPNARRASLRLGFEIGTQHCRKLLDDSTVLGLVSKILVLLRIVLVVV